MNRVELIAAANVLIDGVDAVTIVKSDISKIFSRAYSIARTRYGRRNKKKVE